MGDPSLVRIGIIGCGHVTETLHLPAIEQVPEIEVVAVADLDTRRLDPAVIGAGCPDRHSDGRALIENAAVEAVAICVPPAEHAPLIEAALESGKPVFVEKPLALDPDVCGRLVTRAFEAGRSALVGHNLRHHAQIEAARRIINAGRIGRVSFVQTVFSSPAGVATGAGGWRTATDEGGDVFRDLAVHDLDLMRYLFDTEIETVTALSSTDGGRVATVGTRLANGIVTCSVFSQLAVDVHDIRIFGTEGDLSLSLYQMDRPRLTSAASALGVRGRVARLVFDVAAVPQAIMAARGGGAFLQSYIGQWRHFAATIRDGEAVRCSFEDGRRAVVAASACVESARSGRTVIVPAGETSSR